MSKSNLKEMALMITSRRFLLATLFLANVLFVGDWTFAQERDRVYPFKGAAVTGKIVERTKDKIVIEVRGNNQNFPTNEIQRVVFDGEPQPLSRAKDYVVQGQYEQALDEWKKVAQGTLKTDEMKQDYAFYEGYILGALALRGKGDPAAALKLLTEWVKGNTKSHQLYNAAEMLGNLALAIGNPEQAAKYFGALTKAPFPEVALKGNFYEGKSLLALKKPVEAKAKFASVIDAKLSDATSLKLQKLAKVATIKCDAVDGKSDQAIGELEKMVDEGDSTDGELFAELFNTLGAMFEAADKKDQALLSYLKTDMLYTSQTEAHAEALYHLVQICNQLGEPQMAAEFKQRLGKLYPTSPWAKK